jgi:hypothetical protein
MSAGQESGPEDPQGIPAQSDAVPSEAAPSDEDWANWRSGPGGYSRPVPPSPEPDATPHEEPDPHPEPAAGSLFEPRPSPDPQAPAAPVPPQPHFSHEEPLAYERAKPHAEPGVYERSRRHEEPRAQGSPGGYGTAAPDVPTPRNDPWAYTDPGSVDQSVRGEPMIGSGSPGGESPGRQDPAGHDPSTYRGARPYVGAPDEPSEAADKPHRGIEALGSYDTSKAGEEAVTYHEPGSYQGSGVYDKPAGYPAPAPAPGPSPGPGAGPGLYDEPGSHSGDAPGSTEYGVLGRYNSGLYGPSDDDEPGGYLQQDTGEGPDADDYGDFWRPPSNRGSGVHASRSGPQKVPEPPPLPGAPGTPGTPSPPGGTGDTSVYRRTPPRRQTSLLLAAAIVILVVIVVAVFFLFNNNGPSHHPSAGSTPSAGKSPTSKPSSSSPSSSSPPAAPPLTSADGHLGVPRSIGSLQLNPLLTNKFVGGSVRQQEANSFFIPDSDVTSGFYTKDPSTATFTASDPRLMFLVAYLAGAGNATSALHSFMTNHTFYGQYQISPGSMGGVAACGWLAQQSSPVAHCMWADANSYADFYAWNTRPAALAKTMLATRPQVELRK